MTAPDYPYRPHAIEPGVQKYWDDNRCFEVTEDPAREKFYCLSMLPYPSGRLHMGHVRNYTIGDVISRYQRMRGRNVLQPMGWDAFGLPAENAAIERRMPPAQWTYANIESMKTQLKRLGFAYDWSRELATCTPEYYKWEQWFFNRLLEKNLAYKKMAVVNWDPVEQTVLANEQVENGRGWRSGAVVERREVSQWFIRITDYAEELLADIDKLDGWPESVKTMQRNWIGRSEGVEFAFAIEDGDGDGGGDGDSDSGDGGDGAGDGALSRHPRSPRLKHCGGDVLSGGADKNQTRLGVYTTRPDTLMGITAVFVAGEHPLAVAAARTDPAVAAFVAECRNATTAEAELETLEKRGVPLNRFARHPVSGERVPLWAANFVLLGYGTGAVMAVPAHDQRDWEFAVKHGIEVRPVIAPPDGQAHDFGAGAFTGKDGTLINSGEFDGLDFPAACAAIADHLERAGAGQRAVKYRLRDWGVSRQRYWGCPIPVVYDDAGRAHAVADDDLPVVLPEDVAFSGVQSPLKDHAEFMRAKLPGGAAESATRETDTFDTFVESSWYFHRYCCPGANAMLDARADYWLPVDQYVGGIEHAVLHLLYARFFHKLLRDAGLVASDEPFTNLLTQGMVLKDGAKMSKSKGNTVDPQAMIDKYGADTVRLFIMFAAPPDQALEWNDAAVAGAHRFLRRWWQLAARYCVGDGDAGDGDNPVAAAQATLANPDWATSIDDRDALQLRRRVHAMLDKAARDYRKFRYNTVIAACMELLNAMEKFAPDAGAQHAAVFREGLLALTKTLAPITPHIAHRLWRDLGEPGDVIDAAWPVADLDALAGDSLQLVVQVNGKLRARIEVAADADEDAIQAAALADARVRKYTDGDGKTIAKVIVVPKRLVNVVVRDG